ncbi:hypothetical protein EDD22DRAFT_964700 [Suillus occidentalis]|nr:hypothetical protein EDD22DRAFT_964700 [Suillus occidentalis]
MGPPASIGNNLPPGPSVIVEDNFAMGPWSAGPYHTGYYAQQDDLDANEEDESSNANGGAISANSTNSANGAVLLDNPLDSGFGLVEGTPAQYNSTIKFWNFVDDSLSTMRRIADESSSVATKQEKELQKLFIEVFQADLAEFPGGKKVSKLISKTNPRWQTTIQTGLIW